MDIAANPIQPPPVPAPTVNRLLAIDVTRGFALLGIFFVNIQFFAEPFGSYMRQTPESSDPLTIFCFYFVKIFCEGKFYPLFSMLFGMGLALQMQSVLNRGGEFYSLYLRRLAWLFFMGLTHALLLWYGDILFIYSIAGLVLMFCVRFPPRVLLGIGGGLIVLTSVVFGGLSALGTLGGSMPPPAAPQSSLKSPPHTDTEPATATPATEAESSKPVTPFWRLIQGFKNRTVTDASTGVWLEAETEAYRDGPWLQSFLFRAMSWGMMLIIGMFGFIWHIVGMFFIGAGLLRSGLFTPAGQRFHIPILLTGLCVGIPGAAIGVLLPALVGTKWYTLGPSAFLLMSCGPLVSLFYLMSFALLVRHGIAKPITFILSSVGRMALTNYLTQTVVSTFVFYHWGLAQFGSWTRPERCAFVLIVFACQCLFSVLWMQAFRFGPMEWLWRSVTYFKPQPMLRTRREPEAV